MLFTSLSRSARLLLRAVSIILNYMKTTMCFRRLRSPRFFFSLALASTCAVPVSLRAQAVGPPVLSTFGAQWISFAPITEQLQGSVSDSGYPDLYAWWEYGTDTTYGSHSPYTHYTNNFTGDPPTTSITTSITGLAQNTIYHYRAAASNYVGVSYSSDATFASPGPPVITNQPQSQVVAPGSFVSFSVSAYSTLGVSYQWTKNGVNISNATASTYSIGSAQGSDAATYQATVSNYFDGLWVIYSSPATLKVGGYPPPTLQSGVTNGNFVFAWPVYVPPYALQSATTLDPSNWSNAPITLVTNGNTVTATIPFSEAAAFFRIQHP